MQVFVQWDMTGTWEGNAECASGVTVVTFNDEGLIKGSYVYRQALPAETVLAGRSGRGLVQQAALLET